MDIERTAGLNARMAKAKNAVSREFLRQDLDRDLAVADYNVFSAERLFFNQQFPDLLVDVATWTDVNDCDGVRSNLINDPVMRDR